MVHHGDLYEADFEQFKGFDLLLAGTCCQSLSRVRIESKKVNNGLDGKSGIFFKAIECLRAIQPQYFMFEVVMNIKNKYPISKESGLRGWCAYINGVKADDDFREIRLIN